MWVSFEPLSVIETLSRSDLRLWCWDNGVHFRFYAAQVRYQIFLKITKFMFGVNSLNKIAYLERISNLFS